MTPDRTHFRSVMGHFASGVTIVTTVGDHCHGMTANAVTSVSLDPPMILVCVDKKSRMHDAVMCNRTFALSVLSADQEDLARYFAQRDRATGEEQFLEIPCHSSELGSLLVRDAVAWLECSVTDVYPGGDHSIFLGAVTACTHKEEAEPLTFYRGRFHGMPTERMHLSPPPPSTPGQLTPPASSVGDSSVWLALGHNANVRPDSCHRRTYVKAALDGES